MAPVLSLLRGALRPFEPSKNDLNSEERTRVDADRVVPFERVWSRSRSLGGGRVGSVRGYSFARRTSPPVSGTPLELRLNLTSVNARARKNQFPGIPLFVRRSSRGDPKILTSGDPRACKGPFDLSRVRLTSGRVRFIGPSGCKLIRKKGEAKARAKTGASSGSRFPFPPSLGFSRPSRRARSLLPQALSVIDFPLFLPAPLYVERSFSLANRREPILKVVREVRVRRVGVATFGRTKHRVSLPSATSRIVQSALPLIERTDEISTFISKSRSIDLWTLSDRAINLTFVFAIKEIRRFWTT